MRAGATDSGSSENDRGTGPATSVSPASSAIEDKESHWSPRWRDGEEEDRGGAEFQIDEEFRRKLLGARQLPRRERRQALRAAFDWRRLALKELREKQAVARHARHFLRQLHMPLPR
jgi:hypothetical protein